MTDLADACHELATWLPHAHALIHLPDHDGTRTRGKPGTRPPGNWAVLAFTIDTAHALRHAEDTLRERQGLPIRHRGASHRNTGLALDAIASLSHTADHKTALDVRRDLTSRALRIRRLPAKDDALTWRRIRSATCPYCGHPPLRVAPKAGLVTCIRTGSCFDRDGRHPIGEMGPSGLNGDPQVYWRDGTIT